MRQILNKFASKKRSDIFVYEGHKYLRGYLKHNADEINIVKSRKKIMEGFDTIEFKNPFKTRACKMLSKTVAQDFIEKNAPKMKIIGNMAVKCSCGAGKTLAGILMFSYLGYKTLIVSCRCAINEQWKKTLLNIYHNKITIQTREGLFRGDETLKKDSEEPDVYIYSPQYLASDIKKFPSDVGFIIYDEIHSLLSEEFSKVLTMPFENVINGVYSELPYMLCMSATYPAKSSKEYKDLMMIFGVVYEQPSCITDIPVYVYDMRDHSEARKENKDMFDKHYIPFDDVQLINSILKSNISFYNENIEPTIINYPQYCGFVITSAINTSIYAWLRFYMKYKKLNKRCILIRENVKGCYLLTNDPPDDLLELGPIVSEENLLKHSNFDDFCERLDTYDKGDILFGTYHRLKEGISVQNAVWGICTSFIWSNCARVQILGRIRRTSTNPELNGFKRYFLVNSKKIPTNIGKMFMLKKSHNTQALRNFKLEIEYDLNEEKEIFTKENYIKI